MKKPKPSPERIKELIAAGVPEDAEDMEEALAWIIHEVSSEKREDALKGMMNTGFADPAFPFGASIT